jgi:hypothetical protein
MYEDRDLYECIDVNNCSVNKIDFEKQIGKFSELIWYFSNRYELVKGVDADDLYQEGLLILYSLCHKYYNVPDLDFEKLVRFIIPRRLQNKSKYFRSRNLDSNIVSNSDYCDNLSEVTPWGEVNVDLDVDLDVSNKKDPYKLYEDYIEFSEFCRNIVELLDEETNKLFLFIKNFDEEDVINCNYTRVPKRLTIRIIETNLNWSTQKARTVLSRLRKIIKKYIKMENLGGSSDI